MHTHANRWGIMSFCFIVVVATTLGHVTTAYPGTAAPSQLQLDQGRLTLLPLDISVVDIESKPVAVGELFCFGRELGFCYPDPGLGNLLQNGRLRVHLPSDVYTIIAYGPGYYLTKEFNLRKQASLVLRPQDAIGIRVLNIQGHDLSGALITAAPSQHTPFLRLMTCGTTDKGEFKLYVSRDSKQEIVAVKNPRVGLSDGTAYCLYAPQVTAGSHIVLGGDARRLAQIRWELVNAEGKHCPRTSYDLEIPSLSLPFPIHFWCDQNIRFEGLKLWMTPAAFRAQMFGSPEDRCTVDFYPRLLETKPGQQYLLRAGGKLKPKLLFHPDLNPKQVCVSISDEFGGYLRIFNYPNPTKHATVRLFRPNGVKAHEEMMYGTADKELAIDATGMECEVEIDLDFFGVVRTRGRIDDPQCRLQLHERQSPHFRVEWPVEFDKLYPAFEQTAETCYAAISETLGVELAKNGFYRQSLFGPGWCGGSTFACHYFWLRDPRSFGYADDTFKGAFAHELGHVFQGTSRGYSDFGGPSPIHKEAYASMLRNIAKERLIGVRAARYEDLANRQVFLPVVYDRAGLLNELGKRPYDRGEYWRYYFIVSHLMDIQGYEPLRYFMRFWGDAQYRRPWQEVFDADKFTANEQVCATYSLSCGANLAELFTAAGIPVNAATIQKALNVKPDLPESQKDPRSLQNNSSP